MKLLTFYLIFVSSIQFCFSASAFAEDSSEQQSIKEITGEEQTLPQPLDRELQKIYLMPKAIQYAYLLDMAKQVLALGDAQSSARILNQIDLALVPKNQLTRYLEAKEESQLKLGDSFDATNRLQQAQVLTPDTDPQARTKLLVLKAESYEANGPSLAAANALIAVGQLPTTIEPSLYNERIWMALTKVNAHTKIQSLSNWEISVQQHPNLLVGKNLAQQQQWKVLELESEQGFDIGISTNANAPILESFDSDFTRVSASDPYLDLVMSATHTLYDFGQSESLIDVERQRFIRSKINYLQKFENQSHNLFTLIFERQKTLRTIKESNYSIQQLSEIEQQMSRRFEAGIGTIGEIRRSQLRILNTESKVLMLDNKMEEVDFTLANEYNLEPSQLTEILDTLDNAYAASISLDPNRLRSTEMSLLEQKALRYQLKSIAAQSLPKFDSELNATLYDVTRSSSNYQLKSQIRIKLPAYDSGYRDTKAASTRHALLSEQDTYNQLLQKKTRDYQTNLRKDRDLTSRLEEAEVRQSNLAMQLKSARQALGVTGSDLSGLSTLYQNISDAEISMINITFDKKQLHLDQLLLTEQLLTVLNVAPELTL